LKSLARIILLLTGLTLTAAVAAPPQAAQASAKEAELQRLRSTIQKLSDNLDSLRSQHRNQRAKLHALNRKIGKLDRSLKDTQQQRDRQATELAELQGQRQTKQRRLGDQRRALARQLRAAFLLGQQSSMKLLLNATEPAELQRSLKYYDYFYRSRAEHIAALNNTLLTLNTLEQSIQDKRQALDGLIDRQHSQREALEGSRRERSAVLAELNRDIHNTKQRLSHLKEDEQSLQDLVKRLRRALADLPAPSPSGARFARLKGHLHLPAAGAITARFGSPREVGQLKWQGILIDATDGATVQAVAAGRVVFADWLRGFGLLLILDHGDGYMSLYGYNQDLLKNVGDSVKAGEVIATVGNNGGHTQAGLYFEIRHKGTPLDPLRWCKRK